MEKVCLTTYIYGEKYQDYIPLLVYTCTKTYPDYDIILFLHEKLTPQVKELLGQVGGRVRIIEEVFADCKKMTPLKAKALRWVLWDEQFEQYDYIYVVDIDMLYIKESKPLHQQHIEHMSTTGLSYDNLRREVKRKPFNKSQLGQRITQAGLRGIFTFLFGNRTEYKLTGLHFFAREEYFKVINHEVREKYRKEIYSNHFLKYVMMPNNEVFLYAMMKREGLNPDILACQTQSDVMLDFNNTTRPEFRPHHGIHLGIFRKLVEPGTKSLLECDTYKYYLERFKEDMLTDPSWEFVYNNSSDLIKVQIDRFLYYYRLIPTAQ